MEILTLRKKHSREAKPARLKKKMADETLQKELC